MKYENSNLACHCSGETRHSEGANAPEEFVRNSEKTKDFPLLKKGEGNKRALTLAETLIAIIILGIVAVMTIPYLIQKYLEVTNRTKVKKAMAVYEKAVNKMVIENNIAGSIKSWADEVANCGRTNSYFKVISGGNCRFQTADKIWWDITDIEHPVIAFNEEDLDNKNAKYRFVLLAKSDGVILRVNDPNIDPLTEKEQEALEELYAFINNEKENSSVDSGADTGQGDTPRCSLKEGSETEYKCTGSELTWKQRTIGEGDGITLSKDDYSFCSWDPTKNTCTATDSVASEGPLFVSEVTLTQDDLDKSCEDSRWSNCYKNDYWNAYRKKCLENGARLATAAELRALYKMDDSPLGRASYWAAEANSDFLNGAYSFNTLANQVYRYGGVSSSNVKAVCVGN